MQRSIETISGGFSVTVSERDPGTMQPRAIVPGQDCTLQLDGETVLTGYVDQVRVRHDAGSHEITVAGRDKAGDLVDCSAEQQEWAGRTIDAIAADIARPFGVTVSLSGEAGEPFEKFTIERGETAFDAIDRMCRLRGLLPLSDGKGGVVLGRAARDSASVRLELGRNIISAEGRADWSQRHSTYEIVGQQKGSDEKFWAAGPDGETGPKTYTQVSAEAEDPAIDRHRPLVLLAEQGLSQAEAQERVDWEAAVRRGRSREARVVVQGWRENGADGALWAPGRLVRLVDEWLGLDRQLLVSTVAQKIGESGTLTGLTLMPESAFDPKPRTAPKSGGAARSGNWWGDDD